MVSGGGNYTCNVAGLYIFPLAHIFWKLAILKPAGMQKHQKTLKTGNFYYRLLISWEENPHSRENLSHENFN